LSADNNEQRIPNWRKIVYFVFHLFFIFLLGTGFIYAHDMVTKTNDFAIKEVKISGNSYLNKNEICETSGLNDYENIFDLNISAARIKLENHPWIEKAKVKRRLPGAVEIEIKEQKPLAKINFLDDFIINENGEIFKKLEKKETSLNLPEITGLTYKDLKNKTKNFSLATDLLKKKSLILNNSSIIHLDKDIGIVLYNTDSYKEAVLGFTDFDQKIKNLKFVKLYVKQKFNDIKIKKIDLTNKNRVVLKPFPAMG
jgi:cell division protein FtsQ